VVETVADMPERFMDLLFRFLHQNHGRLSKRAREMEFTILTKTEAKRLEEAYQDLFVRDEGKSKER
jgi:deoxyadenosine/deoxycytidine kinase